MIPNRDRLAASVRALRDLTAQADDGRATRARVLAGLAANCRRQRHVGLAALVVSLALAIPVASAAIVHLARTRLAWTRSASSMARQPVPAPSARSLEGAPILAPAEPGAEPTSPEPAVGRGPRPVVAVADADTRELALYASAHQAHFHEDAPGKALRRWTRYLTSFPHGRFAPEATLNRAICLLRLGDRESARPVLERLSTGPGPAYQREQAQRLLAGLAR